MEAGGSSDFRAFRLANMSAEGTAQVPTEGKGGIALTTHVRGYRRSSLSRITRDAVYANSIFLLLSTVLLAGLGAVFWVVSARLYSPAQVGVATALLAVLNVVTSLS